MYRLRQSHPWLPLSRVNVVTRTRMAWCLLLVVLLLVSTAAGCILRVCEAGEATGSYLILYPSDSTSGLPCECDITSQHTLPFRFKRNAGVDNSVKSGDVTLRSMNDDNYTEVLLEDREEVNGSHFVLTFQTSLYKGETSIQVLQANETFTVKCSPQVHSDRNNTKSGSSGGNNPNSGSQNKDDKKSAPPPFTSDKQSYRKTTTRTPRLPSTSPPPSQTGEPELNTFGGTHVPDSIKDVVIAVSCVVAVLSVLVGIIVVWRIRRTRKQRQQVTDKRQDNLYDIADHLIEPRGASPPMMSLMTYDSCDYSDIHSGNTTFHTNTTLMTNTTGRLSPSAASRTVSEAGYDTPGDTVRLPNSLSYTEHDTYITLKRDCPRREVGTTDATVYDQCQPPGDTVQGSGDDGRSLEDFYCSLQRGQERQLVIGNIYDTTSVTVSVLSGL